VAYIKTIIHLSVSQNWWIFTSSFHGSVNSTTVHLHLDQKLFQKCGVDAPQGKMEKLISFSVVQAPKQ